MFYLAPGDHYRFMKSHEWATLDGNIATVGISDYAQVWRVKYTPYKLVGRSCTGMVGGIHTHPTNQCVSHGSWLPQC